MLIWRLQKGDIVGIWPFFQFSVGRKCSGTFSLFSWYAKAWILNILNILKHLCSFFSFFKVHTKKTDSLLTPINLYFSPAHKGEDEVMSNWQTKFYGNLKENITQAFHTPLPSVLTWRLWGQASAALIELPGLSPAGGSGDKQTTGLLALLLLLGATTPSSCLQQPCSSTGLPPEEGGTLLPSSLLLQPAPTLPPQPTSHLFGGNIQKKKMDLPPIQPISQYFYAYTPRNPKTSFQGLPYFLVTPTVQKCWKNP